MAGRSQASLPIRALSDCLPPRWCARRVLRCRLRSTPRSRRSPSMMCALRRRSPPCARPRARLGSFRPLPGRRVSRPSPARLPWVAPLLPAPLRSRRRPRRRAPASDPYDAEIGDEASWGIVEDFDEEPGSPPIAPAPTPREETDAAPKDSAWQPDPAGPAPEQPAPPAAPESRPPPRPTIRSMAGMRSTGRMTTAAGRPVAPILPLAPR